MSFRIEDQPEFAGPQSETDFGQDQAPVPVPGPARPLRDPAAEAIERTIAAERAADLFKSAPPDALDLTVPVNPEPEQIPEDAA
jgi:hypothetical protein